jgi:hypothetical protein
LVFQTTHLPRINHKIAYLMVSCDIT